MSAGVTLTRESIEIFCQELIRRERSEGTVEQYRRSLVQLGQSLNVGEQVGREALLAWKQEAAAHKAVRTVNCMIAAVNSFLSYSGAPDLRLKSMKCQKKTFSENELSETEFQALVDQARRTGDDLTAALMYAMSGSGVRVSEVRFLTVEAMRARMATIRLKGKTRYVPLSDKLCIGLLKFAGKYKIKSGPIFLGRSGKPLDRRRIWERMKRLCGGAGVDPDKVYPHALRHLFARLFYEITQDIAKLADLLGHSSIETTRIYIMTSSREHRSILNCLADSLSMKKPPQKSGKWKLRTKFVFCPC